MKHVEKSHLFYILQIFLSSVERTTNYKCGFLEFQFEGYGGTQNSTPAKEDVQKVLQEREKVNAALHKLFTKNLDWKVKSFYIYNWVRECTLPVTRKGMFPLVEKNSSSRQYFSLWQLGNLSAALIQNVQQQSGTSSNPGGPQVTAPSLLMQFFSQLLPSCILRFFYYIITFHLKTFFQGMVKDWSVSNKLFLFFFI